jgi:Flp pilus assembly protein TadG
MKFKRLSAAHIKSKLTAKSERAGVLTVEMAICLPLLFLFLFACYEIAHANMLMHATESAAYEAARIGIVPGTKNDKIEDAAKFVLNSVGINDFTMTMTPTTITSSTPRVKIEINVPFRNNTSIPQIFVQSPVFHGECELSREVF